MNFGARFSKVVCIDFSQQHRAFDSLGFGQLRGLLFGELKQGPTDAASLRVTVAPAPVLDELVRRLHGPVFDPAGLDLSAADKDCATFFARRTRAPAFEGYDPQSRLPILTSQAASQTRTPDGNDVDRLKRKLVGR